MKQFYHNALKLLPLLALVVLSAFQGKAENRFAVDDITIDSYDVVNVPVQLFNPDNEIAGFQCTVVLPEQLEFAGTPALDAARKHTSHSLSFGKDSGIISVISMGSIYFTGTEGTIMTIPVKVKEGIILDANAELTIKDITLTGIVDSPAGVAPSYPVSDVTAKVILQPVYSFQLYATPSPLAINPGDTRTIAVGINNDENSPILSMQFNIVLPDGISYVKGSEVIDYTRCSTNVVALSTINATYVNMLLYNGDNTPFSGNTGTVVTFDVKADDSYTGEGAEITIKDVIVSPTPGRDVNVENYTITLTSDVQAKKEADAKVAELEAALATALETIATEASAVAEQYPGTDITAKIQELKDAIAAAYAAGTLTAQYESVVTNPAAEIAAAITKLVEDAKAAQTALDAEAQRKAANEAAYNEVVAQLDALAQAVADAEAAAKETYADADVAAQVEAANAAIQTARDAAEEVYNAVANEGTFAYTVPADEINALIAAITAAAADQKAAADAATEAQRQADNKAAYDAVIGQIDALQTALEAAKAQAAADYPGIDVAAETKAAQDAIDALRAAADAALKAVETEGTFSYTLDTTEAQALIDAIVPAAAAKKNEADRAAANKKAYDDAVKAIDQLNTKLTSTETSVAITYEGYDVSAEVAAARAAIQKAYDDAEAAYKAVATEGTFAYTVPTADIEALIQAIIDSAKAQKAAKEEADRQAKNQELYDAAIATIDELQAALDAAVAETAAYPAADVTEEINAAQAAIDALRAEADAALKAVETEGTFSYTPDTAEAQRLIALIVPAAQAAQAEAERVAANEAAYTAVIDQLDALQAKLDATVLVTTSLYPDCDLSTSKAAAQAAITQAYADANAELERVKSEGNYAYTVPVADIEALIQAVADSARISAIFGIPADEVENIQGIYTLDGLQVSEPRHGTTNVIVNKDGTTRKLYVK